MNTDYLRRPRLLVLSSTWPTRTPAGDLQGPVFVRELAVRLARWFDVQVLVPHRAGLALTEMDGPVRVVRYRYAPVALEQLAYGAGIAAALREARWRWLLVPPFLLAQGLAVWRLRRQLRPDLIHAHWVIPQGVAAVFAAGLPGGGRVPLACTCHGTDVYGFNGGAALRLKRFALQRCASVAVVSQGLAAALRARVAEVKVQAVLPMGVDLQGRFVPAAAALQDSPARTAAPRSAASLLFVGRLIPFKGVDVLLQALSLLVPRWPGLHLQVAGDGPLRERLQAQARALGVEAQVTFLGAVPQARLPDLYQRATACVVPSVRTTEGHEEALGLVMVEALGCGCPVIGSDLPGMADVLQDGRTALTFRSGDASALAQAIDRLLSDPGMAQTLATQGRAHALQQFDWPVVAARHAHWLAALLPPERRVCCVPQEHCREDRLATITVTWQPDLQVLARQLRALPAATCKVVVDNASGPAQQQALAVLVASVPGAHLVCNAGNLGLAAALNRGVAHLRALPQPVDFVLLLDQDSEPAAGSVSILLAGWHGLQQAGVPVGAVGPTLLDPVTGLSHGFHQMRQGRWTRVCPAAGDTTPVPSASLNGSGTLMPRALFEALGGLDASLFIDHVDTEWSFRLQAAGYQLFGLPAAVFTHRMGNSSRRIWLFGWRPWPERSPLRHYYLFRNAVRLLRRPYVPLVWKVSALVKLPLTVLVTLTSGPARWQQFSAMCRGSLSGLRRQA